MHKDFTHAHWMATALQDYSMRTERADQLVKELHDLHDFMQREAERLTFEDEPSTFRRAQTRIDESNGK